MLTTQDNITSLASSQTIQDLAEGPKRNLPQMRLRPRGTHSWEGAPNPQALAEHWHWNAARKGWRVFCSRSYHLRISQRWLWFPFPYRGQSPGVLPPPIPTSLLLLPFFSSLKSPFSSYLPATIQPLPASIALSLSLLLPSPAGSHKTPFSLSPVNTPLPFPFSVLSSVVFPLPEMSFLYPSLSFLDNPVRPSDFSNHEKK